MAVSPAGCKREAPASDDGAVEATSLYSPRLIQALETAARLHATQSRKGTRIPYLAHLLGTCAIALEYGASGKLNPAHIREYPTGGTGAPRAACTGPL